MNGINWLVKYPITYLANGECKLLDAFQVTPKEMMQNKQWDTTVDTEHIYVVQILPKDMLIVAVLELEKIKL